MTLTWWSSDLHYLAIPSFYFWFTRATVWSIRFQVAAEYISALLIVALFSSHQCLWAWSLSAMHYFAFISIYELGYLTNDYLSVRWEENPRRRGPNVSGPMLLGWVTSRVACFVILTRLLGQWGHPGWWYFYGGLAAVFTAHNLLPRTKSISFSWLAAYRFVAPSLFLISPSQKLGLWLSAFVLYSNFRFYSYMDSKNQLVLPERKTATFRFTFYLATLPLAVLSRGYPGGQIFSVMSAYFFFLACLDGIRSCVSSKGSEFAHVPLATPRPDTESNEQTR